MKMSEVTDILNNSSPLDVEARERLVNLDAKIRQRSEALPIEIELDENQISELPVNAYSLHIQFSGLRIVLHRLLSKAASQAAVAETENADSIPHSFQLKSMEHSRTIMYENAVRIARLVSAYQHMCGIENVITVMLDNMYVAAAVLISHLLRLAANDGGPVSARRDFQ